MSETFAHPREALILPASTEEPKPLGCKELLKDGKWNPHALKRALENARKRYDFYEKALLILEAGYMLFPTGSCDLFAVRTKRRTPDAQLVKSEYAWGDNRTTRQAKAQALRAGEGRYVSTDLLIYQRQEAIEVEKNGEKVKVDGFRFRNEDFQDIEFPLEIAKPELMQITSQAMALKFFDEIGVLRIRSDDAAAPRKADPVILGRIIYPIKQGWASERRRLTFYIGWYIDTATL